MNLSEILGEDAAGQFTHGWRDEFNDALTRNDGALTVVGGVVQTAAGVAGVAGGVAMTAGGAVGCAPSAGLTCLAVPAGLGITALSQSEVDAGLDKVLGDYTHTEGLGVALSLSGTAHLGDVSPDIELLKGAGVVGLEILAAKVGGKVLDKVVDKYQDVKSSQVNHSDTADDMMPEADFAGNIGNVRVGQSENISEHMANASINFKTKSIYGGHDMKNFEQVIKDNGGQTLSMKETSIGSGIYEATYILPGGKPKIKTIYDSSKYPNMTELADAAAHKGLLQYQLEGVSGKSSVDIGGIKFEVIVNPAKDGSVNVPTVYPKGVSE